MMGKDKKDPYKEIADSLDIEPDNIELGSQFIEGEEAKADNDKTHSGSISDNGDDNKVFEKVERELKVARKMP